VPRFIFWGETETVWRQNTPFFCDSQVALASRLDKEASGAPPVAWSEAAKHWLQVCDAHGDFLGFLKQHVSKFCV